MTERWLPIAGYQGWYEVSDHGRVRRVAPGINASVGRTLRLYPSKHGYLLTKLCRDGIARGFSVHGLVAAAFIGERPQGMQVNHIDGDRANNMAGNLEYLTPTENVAHGKRLGLYPSGENHWRNRRRTA